MIELLGVAWPEALQRRGYDVGYLPLHLAAQYSSLRVVQLLTRMWEGALRETTAQHGLLPLYLAVSNILEPVDVVRFLVNAWRAALDVRTDRGWLPLHRAARYSTD